MKIAFLASRKSYHATRWANTLANKGYDIYFISFHTSTIALNSKINFIKLPITSKLGYILNFISLKSILKKVKPDLLHVHYASGYGTLGSLSAFHPRLLSVYGSDVYEFPDKSLLNYYLLKKNIDLADWIGSTSIAMAKRTKQLFPYLEKITVTPFGVDINKFRPPVSKTKNVKNRIVIGTVKRLENKYGIDILLESFSIIYFKLKDRYDLSLKIIGQGSERSNLIELSKKLNIDDVTEFKGVVPNDQVPAELNSFDIYVAASRYESESFGVAIVEALACGVPVIVSNVGGLPEVVIHNETGVVVENENILEFSKALEKLVLETELRITLGKNAVNHVKENYDWNLNVSQMESIYKKLYDFEK